MTIGEHQPKRPQWDCEACGKEWPCDPAREALRAEGDLSEALRILAA